MTPGAYWAARRVPKRLRTTGVATITSAPSGSLEVGVSTRRFDDGRPAPYRSLHITASHATIALRLTSRAIQDAVLARTAAALAMLASALLTGADAPGP